MAPPLTTGQYFFDQPSQTFTFAAADSGKSVTATLNWTPNQIITTELVVVPSSAPYTYIPQHGGMQQITKPNGNTSNSAIFSADAGAAYYPSGTALTKVGGSPATGQYACTTSDISVNSVGGYGQYTFAAGDAGKEIVITYQYLDPDYDTWAGQFGVGLTVNSGQQGQPVSAFMSSAHPDQAVGYTRTALIEGDAAFLGTSGVMPNYSYEVQGIGVVGGGIIDADPIVCAQSILTDPLIGIGFPSASIDQASWFNSASSADNWIKANALYVSQAVENQTAAGSIIGRWLEAFNVAAVYSEGLLKLIPYGDEAIGAYTPNTTVVASLTDDNFLADGKDPVKLTRTPWADAHNRVQLGYKSRINSYNEDLVYEQDEASVERFGLRIAAPDSLDFVSTWNIAAAIATMKLKRLQAVRNTYEFALPVTFEYIEPGDLVALTDSRLGLSGTVVRVTKVENDAHSGLSITCEDWPGNGYAMPVANPKAVTPPQHPTHGTASAGGTSAVIVQADNAAPGQTGTRLYIWCTPADSPAWSGCAAFMSTDGSTYDQIGVVTQPGQVFALQGALASVTSNPVGSLGLTHDTTSSVTVAPATNGNQVIQTAGLTAWSAATAYAAGANVLYDGVPWVAQAANSGELPTDASAYWQKLRSVTTAIAAPSAISDAAASALSNLSAVIANNTSGQPTACEFLTFATVAAGAQPNTYTLSDFYRGALSSTITAFAAGAKLVLFSGASVAVDVPAGMAGKVLYFKFIAWNGGGSSRQQLASAPVIQFTVAPSGSAGVLEGLGPPIGDVVRNNAGSGELVVAPRGGVAGNLPYTNHSTTVTGVINGSGQLVNTTALDLAGSLQLGDWHNRVKATIGGSGNSGLDNVLEGVTYFRVRGTELGDGIPLSGAARNFLRNPGFEFNNTSTPTGGLVLAANQWVCDGWQLNSSVGVLGAALNNSTGFPHSGKYCLDLFMQPNIGLPTGSDGSCIVRSPKIAVVPGQVIYLNGWRRFDQSQAPPTNVNPLARLGLLFTNSDGSVTESYPADMASPTAWTEVSFSSTAPGNAVYVQVECCAFYVNNSGSPQTTPATNSWGDMRFDDISAVIVTNLDNEVADGIIYLRMPGANMDSNRRGLIDFTQGGHLSKHLGNIPDDAGSSRYAVLAIDGNRRPLIDFTQGGHLSKVLDNVGDGTIFRRLANVASDNTLHVSTSMLKQGSIVPVAGTCVITFSATSSPAGVNVQVTAGTIYLPDGSTISVPAYNQTFTTWDSGFAIGYPIAPGSGSWSNIFQGNVVWNVATGAVQVQQLKHYIDQVNPTPAPLTGANLAACAVDGLIPLQIGGYADLTTAAGGGTSGGGGSGGGGDVCPTADQPIETQERGLVAAGTLNVGEHIRGERDKWVEVTARADEEGDAVVLILTGIHTRTELVRVSTGHRVMLHDGSWAAVQDIPLYTWLAGGSQLTDRAPIGRQPLAKLSCEGHIYRLGSTISHNTCLL